MNCPYIQATLQFIDDNHGEELLEMYKKKSAELWMHIYSYVDGSLGKDWNKRKFGKPYLEKGLRKALKMASSQNEKPLGMANLYLHGRKILGVHSGILSKDGHEDQPEDDLSSDRVQSNTISRSNTSTSLSSGLKSTIVSEYLPDQSQRKSIKRSPSRPEVEPQSKRQQVVSSISWETPTNLNETNSDVRENGSAEDQSPFDLETVVESIECSGQGRHVSEDSDDVQIIDVPMQRTPDPPPMSPPPSVPKHNPQRRADHPLVRQSIAKAEPARKLFKDPFKGVTVQKAEVNITNVLRWAKEHISSSPYHPPSSQQLGNNMAKLGHSIFQAVHTWFQDDREGAKEPVFLPTRRLSSARGLRELLRSVFRDDDLIQNLSAVQAEHPLPTHIFLRSLIAAAITQEALIPEPQQEIFESASPVLESLANLLQEHSSKTFEVRVLEELKIKTIETHIEPNLEEIAHVLGDRLWNLLSAFLIPSKHERAHCSNERTTVLSKRSTEFRSNIRKAYLCALKIRTQWTKNAGGATYEFWFPRMGDVVDSSQCDFITAEGELEQTHMQGKGVVVLGLLPKVDAKYAQFRDESMTTEEWKKDSGQWKLKVKGQVFGLSLTYVN